MTIIVRETHSGDVRSSHGNASVTRSYIIGDDKYAAITREQAYSVFYGWIATNFPALVIPDYTLPLESVRLSESQNDYPFFRGEAVWTFSINKPTPGTPPLYSYSFLAGTSRRVVPFGDTQFYRKDGKTPIPYDGIAPNNGGYDGAPVKTPEMRMGIKLALPDSIMTPDYLMILAMTQACVNNGIYKGWASGTLLYEGAQIDQRENENQTVWDVSHQFTISPNLTNFTIAGIQVAQKNGHDAIWAATVKKIDKEDTGKPTLPKVEQVGVSPVYQYSDFTVLGIP